jgi:hypothetical protein
MPVLISLDRLWLAERDGSTWALLRKDDRGVYREQERWDGPRRSLFLRCEELGIVPSRDAEAELARLPEQLTFVEREVEKS